MGKRNGGLTELVDLAFKLPLQITGGLGFIAGSRDKSVATVSLLNPKQFEMAVSAGFRGRGFEIAEYSGAPNSGVDLVLSRGADTYLVRCEPWRAQPIGQEVIRQLAAVITRDGAHGGYVVSSGRYSREARELAARCGIQLIDEKNVDEIVGT
jgi:restriction system protein